RIRALLRRYPLTLEVSSKTESNVSNGNPSCQ
ncbi:MAG: hypothetical protein FD124_3634, partial [Alphaproteobacteria bacterium]